jgi:hypothetical protein
MTVEQVLHVERYVWKPVPHHVRLVVADVWPKGRGLVVQDEREQVVACK